MNMDEKIKQDWCNTRFNGGENTEQLRDIMKGRRRSALDNLAHRYRVFSNIGFIMAGISTSWAYSPLFADFAPWVASAMVVLFLTCGLLDNWFCRGVRSINPATMPVAEVAAKALYYRKRHLQAVALLLPSAIALIGFMAYTSLGGIPFLVGVATGAAVGLAIGLIQLARFMADYRELTE